MQYQDYRPPNRPGTCSPQQVQASVQPPQGGPGLFPPPSAVPPANSMSAVGAPPSQHGGAHGHFGKAPGKKGKKWLLVLAVAAAIGGFFVFQNMRANQLQQEQQNMIAEVDALQNVFLQNVYVDDIHLGGMTAEEGLNAVYSSQDARQNSWQVHLTYQGQVLGTVNYAALGIHSDRQEAYRLVRQAFERGKTGTYEERKLVIDNTMLTPYKLYTTQTEFSEERLDQLMQQIQASFTYAPTDAYLAYFYPQLDDPFLIQGENYGSSLDTTVLKSQILDMLHSGTSGMLEVQPQIIHPNVTTADVRGQVTLLHKAVTPISDESTLERTSNIRVAMEKINGITIEPGKTFSFNGVVGARSLENGFKYAIEYVSGEEEMGIGGGVCQASTTVYLAAIQAGMEITKRTAHSDPVSYTTFGQDATVYYTRDRKIDFVFKNNTENTIYITAKVEEVKKNKYQCVVSIYGPSRGENVSYTLRTETVETIMAPLTPIYRKDTQQNYVKYTDQEKLVRKARDGYITETYLQRWEGETLAEETLVSRDTCEPRAAIYYVGTQSR
ncbi:MAG: hypothetical protein E7324_08295 [Clostridiales bacterium]|nr:hypothetical protein [Clostridiales bacterium]